MVKKRGNTKSKKIKFSKKLFSFIIVLGIFVLISAGILTLIDIGHPPDEIIVSINGCDVILQDAISFGWLKDTSLLSSSNCLSEFPKKYHLASEIIVTISGYTLTLQDAINQNYFEGITISPSSTSLPSKGHSADKVEVTIEGTPMTLQNALSEMRATACAENYGQNCGGTVCMNAGTIDCAGQCVGTSPKPRGIDCYRGGKACDGNGNCLGWSGDNCGNCPNGVGSESPASCTIYFCNPNGGFGPLQAYIYGSWRNYGPWCEFACSSGSTYYDWQQKPY